MAKYIATDTDKSELAYLADKITSMDAEQRSLFDAVTEAGWHCGNVSEIINVTENIHCFELQPGTTDVHHGAYSLSLADEQFADTAARLEETHNRFMLHYNMRRRSVDEETYSRNMAKDEGGVYTKQGYLTQDSDMEPIYRGVQDLPADYRTPDAVKRATPAERSADDDKPSVLAQIAEAREARRSQPEHREPPAPGRTNSGLCLSI